jgi:hypothetical protein
MMMNNNEERKDDEKHEKEFELTASEKKALEELRKDRMPSRPLEDRVVQVLRERGFLNSHRHHVIELTTWRLVAAAAAFVIVLATGFMLGQLTGSRQLLSDDITLQGRNDFSTAASLQHAGSAYLLALRRLSALPGSADGQQETQGREVALSTLCTAADQITGLVPKDVLKRQLLTTLGTNSDTWAAEAKSRLIIENNRVIEF